MTFGPEALAALRSGKSHPGWRADPHLRKGFFRAIPVFVLGMALVMALFGRAILRDVLLFYAYGLPVALLANLVWLGVAARSRAKAQGG